MLFLAGEGIESEPYRMYNLDVFEYEQDSVFGLYGSIPFLTAHSPSATTGVFWYAWNPVFGPQALFQIYLSKNLALRLLSYNVLGKRPFRKAPNQWSDINHAFQSLGHITFWFFPKTYLYSVQGLLYIGYLNVAYTWQHDNCVYFLRGSTFASYLAL